MRKPKESDKHFFQTQCDCEHSIAMRSSGEVWSVLQIQVLYKLNCISEVFCVSIVFGSDASTGGSAV